MSNADRAPTLHPPNIPGKCHKQPRRAAQGLRKSRLSGHGREKGECFREFRNSLFSCCRLCILAELGY